MKVITGQGSKDESGIPCAEVQSSIFDGKRRLPVAGQVQRERGPTITWTCRPKKHSLPMRVPEGESVPWVRWSYWWNSTFMTTTCTLVNSNMLSEDKFNGNDTRLATGQANGDSTLDEAPESRNRNTGNSSSEEHDNAPSTALCTDVFFMLYL